jgi:hypothetical protein
MRGVSSNTRHQYEIYNRPYEVMPTSRPSHHGTFVAMVPIPGYHFGTSHEYAGTRGRTGCRLYQHQLNQVSSDYIYHMLLDDGVIDDLYLTTIYILPIYII